MLCFGKDTCPFGALISSWSRRSKSSDCDGRHGNFSCLLDFCFENGVGDKAPPVLPAQAALCGNIGSNGNFTSEPRAPQVLALRAAQPPESYRPSQRIAEFRR